MRFCFAAIVFYFATATVRAQNLIERVLNLFNAWDTTYVTPNAYKFAAMVEGSAWHEDYRLSDQDNTHTLHFTPEASYKAGPYFGYGPFFLGVSFDVGKPRQHRSEISFNLYSSIIGCDIFYRHNSGMFELNGLEGFGDRYDDYTGMTDAFSVDIRGFDMYYVFNHHRFSYPAAYSQSTQQRRSAGSWIAGINYSDHELKLNSAQLPAGIRSELPPSLQGKVEADYHNFGVSVGYAYNYVPARNVLLNLSLAPALTYKHNRTETSNGTLLRSITNAPKHINIDLTARAAVTWNTGRVYLGASWVYHDFNYRTRSFHLNNDFGTARLYAGFNFGRK